MGINAEYMGFSFCVRSGTNMIKTLLATCLVAAVKAEAGPYYLGGYYGVPFGSSTGLDPITQGLDASTQGLAPYAHYGYGHHGLVYGKRSAEADPSTDTDTLLFPSDLPLVWTPSPRDLMLPPRDMLLMLMATLDTDTDTDSSTERGPLRLIPTTWVDTLLFPSDPPLGWTPSPRDLMPPPRDMLLMLMATSDMDMDTDSSTERGPLRLIPTTWADTTEFPLDPLLVWTPSPRDLMPPPRAMLLMLMDTDSMELTLVKFAGKSI